MSAEVAPPEAHVHVVGIGPGSHPRYLTASALKAIQSADLVVYPGSQLGAPIRSLVRGELRWGRWFDDAQIRAWIEDAVAGGRHVAWLCSGDPTLYTGEPARFGSLSLNVAWLRSKELSYSVHAGVSSLQVLLSQLGLEHALPETGCPMALYAPGRDAPATARQRLNALASLGVPIALFLADQAMDAVLAAGLRHYGPGGRVVIGHRVGWPDEWIADTTLDDLPRLLVSGALPRHTLILLGPWHG